MTDQLKARRQVYIETQGCQMNENDSELMVGLLEKEGFEQSFDPKLADLLILNTCQIRGSAEDKAYSCLGRWQALKRQRPEMKIAMAGCVAQQAKGSVFKRIPGVDMVFGTQNIHDLPELVRQTYSGEAHLVKVDRQKEQSTYDFTQDVRPVRKSDISAWVTIIEGCDYFCTYCVVPYTRGRQISRPPESIVEEVKELASFGYKEITLLGQTVDSYGRDFRGEHKYKGYGLAKLFDAVHQVEEIERIRFMTSHPFDLTDDIIGAIANLPRVMPHIHLPMQSGDDEILKRMSRGYTADEYYCLTDKIHDRIPGATITSDYIVGFPGETDAQFQHTLDSVARSGIQMANVAAYSAREQTPAGIWEARGEGVIPDDVKSERLQVLNAEITKASTKTLKPYMGETVEVLVEGASRRNSMRLTGRMRNNTVVNFDSPFLALDTEEAAKSLVGKLVQVKVTEPFPFSLLGVHQLSPDDRADLAQLSSALSGVV